MDIDYKIVVREAIALMRLPDSVRVVSHYENTVTVAHQRGYGTGLSRQVRIEFEKWPIAHIARQDGEWHAPKNEAERVLNQTIEVNIAHPNGTYHLGKTIELLLGV